MIEGIELAKAGAEYADEKQAEDISILDLRGLSSIADFFVVCSGTSLPHLKAIQREVVKQFSENHDLKPRSSEGKPESQWMVLDYVDVILHVFHSEMRDFYAIEDLWSDAPRIAWEGGGD